MALAQTHYPLGAAWWLGVTATVDLVAVTHGHAAPVGLAAALAGTPLAASFADGVNSPDIDHLWAPGYPRHGYHWAGHRGFTHRVWFATLLTVGTAIVQAWAPGTALRVIAVIAAVTVAGIATRRVRVLYRWAGYAVAVTGALVAPLDAVAPVAGVLVWAPVTGWWSHLVGDMIYGKLKVGPWILGLGWETGGVMERGRLLPASAVAGVLVLALTVVHIAYGGLEQWRT